MGSPVKYNPETKQAIVLSDGKWVPTQAKHNAEGAAVAFDGEAWVPVGGKEPSLPTGEPTSGVLWPISYSSDGEPSFDPNAGVLGSLKRTFTLPGEVLRGEIDPTSNEGLQRALESASVMSPMGVASRVPGSLFAPKSSYKTGVPKPPTRSELKAATDAGYAEARGLGAEYTSSSVKSWAEQVSSQLNKEGRIAENYPKVHSLLNKLLNPPKDSSITLESVDALYKELGTLGGDAAEGKVASLVQRSLDDFHASLGPENLVSGTASPARAADILKEARGNAAAGFRSDDITGLEKTVARRTAAANSGRNTDNTIRQRLTSLIESKKGSRGLSKGEEEAIDNIIFGGRTKNSLRTLSNLLGGGGGLGQTLLSGGLMVLGVSSAGPGGALLGLVPQAVGSTARNMANTMSKNELRALDDMVRSRSPLHASQKQSRVYSPPVVGPSVAKAAVAPGLLSNGSSDIAPQGNPLGRYTNEQIKRFIQAGGT